MRRMTFLSTIVLLVCVTAHRVFLGTTVMAAETKTMEFEGPQALNDLDITGDVTIDVTTKHGGAGSLKLAPGSKAVLKLRDNDGTGKVELWVYEDEAKPAAPKKRGAGAMWCNPIRFVTR